MTESDCQTYIERVKRIVSQLKAGGETTKDSDVAYTILAGLGEKYSSLVTTLTNMITPDKALTVSRVMEAILTEELRIKNIDQAKSRKNADNPLAFKHDTSFKGSLSSVLVARTTDQHMYRHAPYYRGGMCHLPYRGRGGYRSYSSPQQRYYPPWSLEDNPNWPPWGETTWKTPTSCPRPPAPQSTQRTPPDHRSPLVVAPPPDHRSPLGVLTSQPMAVHMQCYACRM